MRMRTWAHWLCAAFVLLAASTASAQSSSGGFGGSSESQVGIDLDGDGNVDAQGLLILACKASNGVCDTTGNGILTFDFQNPVPKALNAAFANEMEDPQEDCEQQGFPNALMYGISPGFRPVCKNITQGMLPPDLQAQFAWFARGLDFDGDGDFDFGQDASGNIGFDVDNDDVFDVWCTNTAQCFFGSSVTAFGAKALTLTSQSECSEPESGKITICNDDGVLSYRLNGGSSTPIGGGGSFTPNTDPESDHSGFDAAVYSDVDLAAQTSAANYTVADNGHSGESLAEHIDGIDDRLGSLSVWDKEYSIVTPADADDHVWFRAPYAITITDIDCIIDPADSGESISITFRECDATGDSCTAIEAAITADNDGASDNGIDNPVIDAGDWVDVLIGAPSGTVSSLACTLVGTR